MYAKCLAAVLHFSVMVRVLTAYECTPCDLRTCPQKPPHSCENGRTLAQEPCGCCEHCTRLEWEPCAGQDWALGYCGLGLTCAAVNGTGVATPPDVGICKVLLDRPELGVEDERCPLLSGCNKTGGQCVCDTHHACVSTFTYSDMEACMRATRTEGRRYTRERGEGHRFVEVEPAILSCSFSGCNLTALGCVCETDSCLNHFSYINLSQCHAAAEQRRCAGITCPNLQPPDCPGDSALSRSYTPPAGCCPTVLPVCTCDFRTCPRPECPSGHQRVHLREATGVPGDCCHSYECQKVPPKCAHNGQEFSDGQAYRMDPCWLCQCRGGISFCSKADCIPLDCDNFYIPEGECCPVCIDVELLSVDSAEASCWVNHKLRRHEEQWREDDCTFCQCVDGEPRCTAMACKQSCHNPVRVPGECCPYCEEPTYETVSPLLCPRLENCSLSGSDCPQGFLQDVNGCLLCQCLQSDSCPKLWEFCSILCPFGYQKDDFGCEMCECSPPTAKCRPLSCSKTCPHGYVRNKRGCEICRCVRCPAFTCDKHCSDGYQSNKAGCSVCLCKEGGHTPSTTPTTPAPRSCLTGGGHHYEEGESWHDGCRDCYCQDGREMCMLITCPVPSCPHPAVRPEQCCPTCEDDSGSGQPEGVDLVVCRAPGGEFYVEGETWKLDECTSCTCRKGRVLCDTEVCPPTLCRAPARSKETCCYVCPDDHLKPLLPVDSSQQDFCISREGDVLMEGDSWKADACTSCTCHNDTIQCYTHSCPPAHCRVPVLRKGQCCPQCLDGTTTTRPFVASTHVAAKVNSTGVEQVRVWVTTHKLPPVVVTTDGKGLGAGFPGQTEVALIYQSAAWILAGLLLAIVIFLIVALIVNRKKKWVQMSFYSAPKKTVILKKHVNTNSVLYMEHTKENKIQSVNFGPEEGLPCGDGLSIPRAKLSNTPLC